MINNKNYIINNSYSRIVNKDGNLKALEMLNNYFEITDYEWRGLGVINNSGLKLKKKYELYDATCRFNLKKINNCNCRVCPSGDILKGKLHPKQCDFFGKDCTPEHPIGVSMVSTEGACSAFYRYK